MTFQKSTKIDGISFIMTKAIYLTKVGIYIPMKQNIKNPKVEIFIYTRNWKEERQNVIQLAHIVLKVQDLVSDDPIKIVSLEEPLLLNHEYFHTVCVKAKPPFTLKGRKQVFSKYDNVSGVEFARYRPHWLPGPDNSTKDANCQIPCIWFKKAFSNRKVPEKVVS